MVKNDPNTPRKPGEQLERGFPVVLRVSQYICPTSEIVTPETKARFLENFYRTGNLSHSAKEVGTNWHTIARHVEKDPVFARDFELTKAAIKHDLEGVMYSNGMTTRGYMDRITWLRRHYPQEYNPNFNGQADKQSAEAVKQLADRLKEYDVIPKNKIIDVEDKSDAV